MKPLTLQIDFGEAISDADIQSMIAELLRNNYRVKRNGRSIEFSHPNNAVMERLKKSLPARLIVKESEA